MCQCRGVSPRAFSLKDMSWVGAFRDLSSRHAGKIILDLTRETCAGMKSPAELAETIYRPSGGSPSEPRKRPGGIGETEQDPPHHRSELIKTGKTFDRRFRSPPSRCRARVLETAGRADFLLAPLGPVRWTGRCEMLSRFAGPRFEKLRSFFFFCRPEQGVAQIGENSRPKFLM